MHQGSRNWETLHLHQSNGMRQGYLVFPLHHLLVRGNNIITDHALDDTTECDQLRLIYDCSSYITKKYTNRSIDIQIDIKLANLVANNPLILKVELKTRLSNGQVIISHLRCALQLITNISPNPRDVLVSSHWA